MVLKICGMTRVEDAQHAVAHGATAIGFIFWPRSPRHVSPQQAAGIVAALPRSVMTVGVFVNEALSDVQAMVERTGISAVQLHGDEQADGIDALRVPVIRSMTLDNADGLEREWPEATTFLLDAADPVRRGGTGRQVNWNAAAQVAARRRVILAGGLTPANVAEAISVVRPWGVDVSSGVEASPGVKNLDAVAAFLRNARAAFDSVDRVPLDPAGKTT
jgi:phosphoribosylanthranilate isomerase